MHISHLSRCLHSSTARLCPDIFRVRYTAALGIYPPLPNPLKALLCPLNAIGQHIGLVYRYTSKYVPKPLP